MLIATEWTLTLFGLGLLVKLWILDFAFEDSECYGLLHRSGGASAILIMWVEGRDAETVVSCGQCIPLKFIC